MNDDEKLVKDLKGDYHAHLARLNPSTTSEGTYRASCFYYRGELLPLLPANRDCKILDLGCGFGHLLRFCCEQGYRNVSGVEIDAKLQAAAQQYLGKFAIAVARS